MKFVKFMQMKFSDILKAISFNHVTRILFRLEPAMSELNDHAPEGIRNKANEYYEKIKSIHKKVIVLIYIMIFLYLLLYISIVSIMTRNLFFIEEAVKLLDWIAGVAGSFVIISLLFIINKVIKVNITEATVLASYIVAYGVKYDK